MPAYKAETAFAVCGGITTAVMILLLWLFIRLYNKAIVNSSNHHFIIWLLLTIAISFYAITGVVMCCISLNPHLMRNVAEYISTGCDLDILILHWVYVWEIYIQSVNMQQKDLLLLPAKKYKVFNICNIVFMNLVVVCIILLQSVHKLEINCTVLFFFEFLEDAVTFLFLVLAYLNIRKTMSEF